MVIRTGRPLIDGGGFEDYIPANPPAKKTTATPTPAAPKVNPIAAAIPVAGVVNTTRPAPAAAPAPVATPQQQAAAVAQVVAAAIIKSPVVVDTPKNVAPDKTTVESIAREIAAVVAPFIATDIPPKAVEVIAKETAKAVVTNPEVKASDVGQAVDTKVAAAVAEKVSASTPVVNSIAASIPVAGVFNTTKPAATPAPASTPTNAYLDAIMGKTSTAAPTETSTVEPVRVTVKKGQTLEDIAKENNTTVTQILSLPGNATIAARVEEGTQPVFSNSKVVIPPVGTPTPASSGTTYNERVVESIKSGTQPTTDINANPVTKPTEEPVKGFTPPFPMPEPKIEPGEPGFVGPVAPVAPVEPVKPVGPVEPVEPTIPERTMAIDTFKNTLALFFGSKEVAQPWVNALYNVTSKYYKTGSTIDESLNLALQDVRNNKELEPFTKRFKGLYDLQDKLVGGEAISVPTIAEFFKSQEQLGEVMRRAGFQDLATQEFLGDVLGTGKSVAETTSLINDVFAAIDNAPEQLKKDLAVVAPGADRTAIAKALLLGSKGAAALNKQIAATSVFSAAKSQGLAVDMATAADYAARGIGYGESLTGFGNVARGRAPLEKLTEISTGKAVTPEEAQKTLQQSIFENNVAAQEQIRLESEKEMARFGSRPGTMGSRSLASRNRANRVI